METSGPAKRFWARTLAIILGLLLVLGACGGQGSTQASEVTEVAQRLMHAGASSVIVSVSDHGHEDLATVATAGTPRPSPDQRFRVGSVTKTFTATIVLQLVAEGRLRLSDTFEHLLPGEVPAGARISIRELLEHRSGLANFSDYPSWLRQAERHSRPIDSLRFAASRGLDFAPGSQWRYSNTNYIALGLIIEKVTGQTLAQQLQQRIFRPLGLQNTELATTRHLPDLRDDGENPNVPWAAGSIVSNADDLSRFFSALLSGQILSRASLAQMKHTLVVPGMAAVQDGLGLFSTAVRCGHVWGHNGGILDYGTGVDATEDGSRVAVISVRGPIRSIPEKTQNEIKSTLLCPQGSSAG